MDRQGAQTLLRLHVADESVTQNYSVHAWTQLTKTNVHCPTKDLGKA